MSGQKNHPMYSPEDERTNDDYDYDEEWGEYFKTAGKLLLQGILVGFGTAAGHSWYTKMSGPTGKKG